MKKIFLIFIVLFSSNAFALYTETIVGGCNVAKKFYPFFQINTYTCANGYFLPANTVSCQPCPSGHTCPGGTFQYNETKAQGITFATPTNTNVPKGCSVNFGTKMIPIFTPKTVSLTWNNGNSGMSTQTTCTYDRLINLPPEPTRPGYVFNGWVVEKK